MPAKSQKQANLMRAAAHGADFPMARKVRESMTPQQMQDFSRMRHSGHTEDSHHGTPGRKPKMRHG